MMTAESPQPGEITLHGLVNLDNRRPVPGKPNSFVFDAIFCCLEQTRDGVGSLRHYIGIDKDKKTNDVYDIQAKVRTLRLVLHTVSSCALPDCRFQSRLQHQQR